MTEYIKIIEILTSRGGRKERIRAVADLLQSLPSEEICPAVRLLTGSIRPSWSSRALTSVNVVRDAILSIYDKAEGVDLGEMAENAILHRRQSSITNEILTIDYVYSTLNKMLESGGKGSDDRRRSLLIGLLLSATPLEGRYIVLTSIGFKAGIGPKMMASAISQAFRVKREEVWQAYSRLPDMGLVALSASSDLHSIRLTPGIPFVMMEIPVLKEYGTNSNHIFYPRRGIRVQIHLSEDRSWLFTARRKDISHLVEDLKIHSMSSAIMEGELTVTDGRSLKEVVRLINRKRRSKRSAISPSLVLWDLLYMDGRELVDMEYSERLSRLSELCQELYSPSIEISQAKPLDKSIRGSYPQLMARAPSGLYLLGMRSKTDFQTAPYGYHPTLD